MPRRLSMWCRLSCAAVGCNSISKSLVHFVGSASRTYVLSPVRRRVYEWCGKRTRNGISSCIHASLSFFSNPSFRGAKNPKRLRNLFHAVAARGMGSNMSKCKTWAYFFPRIWCVAVEKLEPRLNFKRKIKRLMDWSLFGSRIQANGSRQMKHRVCSFWFAIFRINFQETRQNGLDIFPAG